jgi:TonB family protein
MSGVRLLARLGEAFAIDSGSAPIPWHADLVATRAPEGIALAATFTRDGRVLAQPMMVLAEGQPGFIEIGERGSPDFLRLDATMFLHPMGGRADTAPGMTRPATESTGFPPSYPPAAVTAHQQGHLDLRVDVDDRGQPLGVAVAKADPPEAEAAFGASAIDTVMRWTFNPALQDGRAIASTIVVPIDYRFSDDD